MPQWKRGDWRLEQFMENLRDFGISIEDVYGVDYVTLKLDRDRKRWPPGYYNGPGFHGFHGFQSPFQAFPPFQHGVPRSFPPHPMYAAAHCHRRKHKNNHQQQEVLVVPDIDGNPVIHAGQHQHQGHSKSSSNRRVKFADESRAQHLARVNSAWDNAYGDAAQFHPWENAWQHVPANCNPGGIYGHQNPWWCR